MKGRIPILILILSALMIPVSAQEPLVGDVLIPPDLGVCAETSEYMMGSIAVGLFLPESDGSIDPSTEDWTHAERWHTHNEIVSALNWWAAREPKANLSFVVEEHYLPTSYEPIACPHTDQGLWIREMMEQLGYTESAYFASIRAYNADLVEKYATDWAFTIFVVDSSNDGDNKFPDGVFAYAYLGGPFMVMTYGNDGYGPSNMDMVCAHEIGHIFHALDQRGMPCSRTSGCADVPNRNSNIQPGCASPVPSIMKWAPAAWSQGLVDKWARGQVGWWDYDMDGIFDCVDPDVTEPFRIYLPVVLKRSNDVHD